jgi:hypothetical protein
VDFKTRKICSSNTIFRVFARSLQTRFPVKKSMVARRPTSKLPSGVTPAAHNFVVDAIECFTSPERAGKYLISEREPVKRQIIFASSLMVSDNYAG